MNRTVRPAFGLTRLLGLHYRGSDVLDPRQHRRQAEELGPRVGGDQARQGGLAGARWAPKINECRRSLSIARRNGLPSPSTWGWPMYSSRLRGRIRSARGRVSRAPGANRSCVDGGSVGAKDVYAGRRHETEQLGVQFRVTLQAGEAEQGDLAEAVLHLQLPQQAVS